MATDCVLFEENGEKFAIPSLTNKIKQFKNFAHQIPAPVVVYVTFHALHIQPTIPDNNNNDPNEIYHYQPYSFCYFVCYKNPKIPPIFYEYIGDDCMRRFWLEMEIVSEQVYRNLMNLEINPSVLNRIQKKYHKLLSTCYYCKRKISGGKLRGFSPIDGQYLGAIHEDCEQIGKQPNYLPVFVYNFSKFASIHLLNNCESNKDVKILGHSLTHYKSITKTTRFFDVRLTDANEFLKQQDRIEELIKNLPMEKREKTFKYLFMDSANCKDLHKFSFYFPFDYVNDIGRLSDRKLPEIDEFYDILKNSNIIERDYRNCIKLWDLYQCKNIRDYLQIYQKFIVLSIADFYENLRTVCMKRYNLDPVHNISIPAFAWDVMQLMLIENSPIKLEYITDVEMYKLLKNNIRGGYSHASKRFAFINNPELLPEFYNETDPVNFLLHIDANNLSGWSMSQYLPYGDYQWLTNAEIRMIEKTINDIDETNKYGFILEVDLIYPKELHDEHNDLPFCCEHDEEHLLITQFTNKKNYLTHYRNLQQFIKHGLILERIHRGIKFKQTKWLEPFITLNTKLRQSSKTQFEQKFYKQLNNSIHGKFNRNVDKEMDYVLLSNDEAKDYIDSNYNHYKLNENFVIVEKPKLLKNYNKLMCIGFTVYELSKFLMYEYHYEYFRNCGYPIQLLYTNTDSFIYEIQCNNFYIDILKNNRNLLSIFDTTGLSRWGIREMNDKIVGKMKDESKGRIIFVYYGAGSQKYFLIVEGDHNQNNSRKLTANDYEQCIFDGKTIEKVCVDIVNKEYTNIIVMKLKKCLLNPTDPKRCISYDNITTYAKGHYLTKNNFSDNTEDVINPSEL